MAILEVDVEPPKKYIACKIKSGHWLAGRTCACALREEIVRCACVPITNSFALKLWFMAWMTTFIVVVVVAVVIVVVTRLVYRLVPSLYLFICSQAMRL